MKHLKLKFTMTLFLLGFINANATKVIIQVANYSFTPASVTVTVGDTIVWNWAGGSHTTTSVSIPTTAASWDAAMDGTNTTFEYKITAAGTYNYECTPHSFMMTGKIIASSSNASCTASITPGGSTTFSQGGFVTLTANSGSSYLWSNGLTTKTITVTTSNKYIVKVTDANGCISKDSVVVTVNTATGINEMNQSNKISIYPNPFSTSAVINLSSLTYSENLSFSIYDILGNEVRKIAAVSKEQLVINRDGLLSGIYFYQLNDVEKVVASGRLIVE